MWDFYRKFFVWEQRKLGDIAKIVGGGTPSTKNSQYWNGNINWYSPTEIGKNAFVNESKKKITKAGLQHSSAKLLPKNKTILFTSRANIGDLAIMTSDGATNQGFQSWVIDQLKIDIYFLYSLGNILKNQAIKLAYGSTFLEISNKNVKNLQLKIPNIQEQKKIGSLFKIIDELLTLQERKYEELKLLKKALMQNMFANKTAYPKLRFNGFNSKWKSYKLKEIGKIVTGNTPPTKDLNNYSDHGMLWVTPTDITGPIIRNTVKRLSPIGITKARTAKEGSILVTCIASIGKNALTETRCGFNQQINAVIPNQYNDSYFLLIQSKFWSKKAKQIAAKGTIKIVNKKDFSNLSFLYPKLKEQKNMSSFFKLLDMVTTFQMKNLIELKKIKHFLLQNMFI